MDDKYKHKYEQFKKYQEKKKKHLEGPVPYAPYPREWDEVPPHYKENEWQRMPKKYSKEDKPKRYQWTPQDQALEDILWAS
jgi:hypothetical protein